MPESKFKLIREFCAANSNPEIILKYSRYFKEGFDGYGIDQKTYERQRDAWIEDWGKEMSIEQYLELGDMVFDKGKYEEKSFVISLLKSKREEYNEDTFDRIALWFEHGVTNWATTDVMCMLVLSDMIDDKVIDLKKLKTWNSSGSEWKRRAVPVTLVELVKEDLKPMEAFETIESLMTDSSKYVQKGIGTLMRGLWKKYPEEIEDFLLKWKDECGRLIIQYATEKMDKDYRKKFRKSK